MGFVTSGPAWVSGWNIPGYLPDDEPLAFDTWLEAKYALREEVERAIEDHSSAPGDDPAIYSTLLAQLDACADDERFSERCGNYVWWIEHVVLPTE